MSSGGGSQQSSSQVSMPAWLDEASQETLGRSRTLSLKPYEAYGGQRLAGLTSDQMAAQRGVQDMQGQYSGQLSGLAERAGQIGQGAVPQVHAGSLNGVEMHGYMNPYLNQVEAGALTQVDRARQLAQVQGDDRARGAGAFGGSRQAIQAALTDSEAFRQAGDLSANIRHQGYNTALQTATADLNRGLQAQTSNQGAYLQNLGLGLQGIQAAGALTSAAHDTRTADIDALSRVGAQNQQQRQAGLDIAAQDWQTQQGYDRRVLNEHMATIQGVPHGQTQVSTSPMQGGNPAMGALGGAASGAMMGSALGPWGTVAGGVIGGVAGLFGSRR